MSETLKVKAINDYVTIKRIPPTREGMIQLVDQSTQKSFYGIIKSVGPRVKNNHIVKDRLILCNSNGCLTIKGVTLIKEQYILMSRHKNTWRPIGNKILVQRMNSEFQVGMIILPNLRKHTDQTLHCVVIANGIINDGLFNSELEVGETIRLDGWNKDIQEVEIDDNFYLIIKPNHILYKYEGDDSINRIID